MPQKPEDLDYHALSTELQELIEKLEDGSLDIDVAVQGYERGLAIIKLLETRLTNAENKVAALSSSKAD